MRSVLSYVRRDEWRSRLAPHLTLALCLLAAAQILLLITDALLPPPLAKAERASPVALDRRGAWLRALPVEDGRWRIRADLGRTDPVFVRRLIAVEDARFRHHLGVDPLAVARAAAQAAATGRVRSGASTLSMQTARLLEPRPRTLGAKLVEAVRAVQLEARLSKDELLAAYLTLAPYGGNLEGVRAASLAWFGHEPSSLTDGEQALLIALPQAPEGRRPDRRPEAAARARAQVLDRLRRAGLLDGAQAADAAAEPLPVRQPFPALAWQAAGQQARAAAARRDASVLTTLDAGLQSRLEPLVAAAAARQGPQTAAAVLVVEARTGAARALAGSAGLDSAGGWLDLTAAQRSPGSALKPFIYGLAFDQGAATPDTLVDDAQTRFADYRPENFDRRFHGRVTVRDALTHSLNVPAVAALERVGPEAFEARLEAVGVRLKRPKTQLRAAGLALALGGEGMTLRDLARLYAALGDGGLARPLAFAEAEARRAAGARRLLSPSAAKQVADILRETPPPAGRAPSALTAGQRGLAYKTGTSYGFRDALAAGVGGGYAIVVWLGRPDGGAGVGLTGRDVAAPLLFDVADLLAAPRSPPPAQRPRQSAPALERLTPRAGGGDGPQLIFPPDGAVVQVEALGAAARGLALAARGEDLSWYVDGAPLRPDGSGAVIWRPAAPGFYRVEAADPAGRRAAATVRIKGG